VSSLVLRPAIGRASTTVATLAAGGPFRRATTAGTIFVVFAIPWQETVSALPAITKPLGIAVVLLGAVALLAEGRRRRLSEAQLLAAGFAGIAVSSLLWTIDTSRTLADGFAAAQVVALFLLIWEFCPGREGAIVIARAYTLGCGVVAGQTVGAYLMGAAIVDDRITLGATNPNDVSFGLCMAIPLAWYLSYRTPHRVMVWAYRTFVPVALYAIVLSASRSGLVVGLVGAVIVPWTLVSGNRRRSAALLMVIAVALPLAPRLLPSEQSERLSSTAGELSGGTLNGRTDLWSAAWATFAEHPIVGVGAGASREPIEERTGLLLRAHNTPLSVAAELGALGLVVFALLALAIVRPAWLATTGLERKLFVVLCLVLGVGLQVRHWEYEKALWAVLAILAGLGARSSAAHGGQIGRRPAPPAPGPHA
jgi:O-antigen ligase